MTPLVFKVAHGFGGSGGGALGFLLSRARLFDRELRFECRGSIDLDPVAGADFERFTGSRTLVRDVRDVTPAEARAFHGERLDAGFCSAPCVGASRLLSSALAATAKYQDMNELALIWARLILDAYADAPPSLLIFENVPGLVTRAKPMLRELRKLLRSRGYVVHESAHDCGEIGGLAQHRDRWLLVARHAKACPQLLYQPQKKRVRACGEVLSDLPVPATDAARPWGVLHEMPRLSWTNWRRLALIPAGGDWRDLAGVLDGRARREVFRRHAIAEWAKPIETVTGPGGHAIEAIDDPRVDEVACAPRDGNWSTYGVTPWADPASTVAGESSPSNGRYSVADPRVEQLALGHTPGYSGAYGVQAWDDASKTIASASKIDNRPVSIADPRAGAFHHVDRVRGWDQPVGTVTSSPAPSSGRPAVADPRLAKLAVLTAYDAGYGVLRMDQPARAIAGTVAAGTGAYAVADGRDRSAQREVRILTLDEALALDLPGAKPPPFLPVIIAEDGTWHRPLTLLELAALQGYPLEVRGERLSFGGTRTQIARHIGNSVPPPAGSAIARQFLLTLGMAALGGFALDGTSAVWVDREHAEALS